MTGDLKSAAVEGMAWTGLERLVLQVLRFAVGLVMARLLVPADYGVVGMLAIFMAIAGTFQDFGFGAALIQKKVRTEADYSTVFYFNLATACLIYAVFFFAAPWIAAFYQMPILTPITRAIALNFVIGALGAVQQTRLTVELKFRLQAVLSIVGFIISSFIGITLACRGYGPWALVGQGVLSGFVNTIILWCVTRWHPAWVFSAESFKSLFGFGWKLLCSSMINTVYSNVHALVIGKAFGAAEVGHFNRALGFADLPAGTLQGIVLKVNYPILARFQDDTQRLVSAYRSLLRAPMFVLVPVLFGMAAVGEPMVRVLIGEKWLPCVAFLRVLCLGVLWEPLTHINLNLLYVKGRTDLVLKLELIKKPIAFLILACTLPFGIFWMCVGRAVYEFIAFCFNCYYTKKFLGYGFQNQLRDLLPLMLNGLLMAVTVRLAIATVGTPVLQLLVGVSAGAIVYIGVAMLYRDETLRSALDLLRKKRAT